MLNLDHYKENIGKKMVCINQDLPIMIVQEVKKYPFKNMAVYKFFNTDKFYFCEDFVEFSYDKQKEKLENLKKLIGSTVYDNNTDLKHYYSFYQVTSVFFDEALGQYYFVFDNNEIGQVEKFSSFKDSKFSYSHLKYSKHMTRANMNDMLTLFQSVQQDLLCFDVSDGEQYDYKIKGYCLTKYSNESWYFMPIMYDTRMNNFEYSYILEKAEKRLAQKRDNDFEIEKRSFYFLLLGKVTEFNDITENKALQQMGADIIWTLKYRVLHEKLNGNTQKTLIDKVKKTKL